MNVVATYLEQKTCYLCDRPPLTFDEQDRALCAHHATMLLAAPRIDQGGRPCRHDNRNEPGPASS